MTEPAVRKRCGSPLSATARPSIWRPSSRFSLFQGLDRPLPLRGGVRLDRIAVVRSGSELYAFSPDVVVLLNSTGKLRKQYHAFGESKADFPDRVVQKMAAIWDAIARQSTATVLQSTFVLPIERLHGNFDNRVEGSLYACAQRVNAELT